MTGARIWLPALALSLVLAGCTSASASDPPSPEPAPALSAQATPSLSPQSMPAPTATARPLPPPTATPTPTPGPTLRRLGQGGCCPAPFWAPDSRTVLFIDKPDEEAPSGIWALDSAAALPEPRLVTERVAFYTADLRYRMEIEDGLTFIERLPRPLHLLEGDAEGERWSVATGDGPVELSPARKRIAWTMADQSLEFEQRVAEIWVADLDGENAERVAVVPRGGLVGWLSEDSLLLSGRQSLQSLEQIYYALSIEDGSTVELARGERVRGASLSPGRKWMAYYVTFEEDPDLNGLWIVGTDGSGRRWLDGELFGAYQWRDANRLLIIPLRPEAQWHELWQYDLEADEASRLTDPREVPFKIASGYWAVSPDGEKIVFVQASDRNLWLLTLPD